VKAGLAFWLRTVNADGGLAECIGDTTLVMMPPKLQEAYGLPGEVEVTDDPDVARDDGVTFLGAGHPAIARAAELVLAEADVGHVYCGPTYTTPAMDVLEQKARIRFPIAHGRLDLVEPPVADTLHLVRIGVLIRYALSDDDQYQEQHEHWVDAETRLVVPTHLASRLLSAEPSDGAPDASTVDVTAAVAAASQGIDAAATRRRAELARDLTGVCRDELARAESYYAAQLESIAKRWATAPPDRQALLDARSQATRAERARRLEEIAAKYRGTHEVQPFRLHVLHVTALRLQAEVRRGERRYPLRLTWLPAAGDFTDVRCPHCGRLAPLDAGKNKLGCIACQAKAPTAKAPTPADTQQSPSSSVPHATTPGPVAAPKAAPVRPQPPAAGRSAHRPHENHQPALFATPAGRAARQLPKSQLTTAVVAPAPRSDHTSPARSSRDAKASDGRTSGRDRERTARPTTRPPAQARTRERDTRRLADVGGKLAIDLWQSSVNQETRRMRRLAEPGSPFATQIRLYGSLAPAAAIGMPVAAIPDRVNSHSYPDVASGRFVTSGEVLVGRTAHRYAVHWQDDHGRRTILNVGPYAPGWVARFMGADYLRAEFGDVLFEMSPEPVTSLDPVAAAIWTTTRPRLGLGTTVRALTSWWRLGPADSIVARFPVAVVAAALERAACYWGGGGPGAYAAVAEAFDVPIEQVRAAGSLLQKSLKLTADQPW
jgi:hypothetical protein